jgi:putative flippase GtrA
MFSAVIAFLFAVTNSFILNKNWTFKHKSNEQFSTKYLQFFIISVVALLINLFTLWAFTELFGFYYMFSQIIGLVLNVIINYFGNKLWTFKKINL